MILLDTNIWAAALRGDLWIAAQALAEDALLVTDNTREFRCVPGLRLENWLRR